MNREGGGVLVTFYVVSESGVMPADAINKAIEVSSWCEKLVSTTYMHLQHTCEYTNTQTHTHIYIHIYLHMYQCFW